MIPRKRRAPEPASSPRTYKQARLSPQDQNNNSLQPPDKVGSIIYVAFRAMGRLLFGTSDSTHEKSPSSSTHSLPVSSSSHLSSEDEISRAETTPPRFLPPKVELKQRFLRERRLPSTQNGFPTSEEVAVSTSPFHEIGSPSHFTPNGHLEPSSSITTTNSNPQPPSSIEYDQHLLVDKVDHIRLDSSYASFQSSQIARSSFSREETSTARRKPFRPRSKHHIHYHEHKAAVRQRNREALKLRSYHTVNRHELDGNPVKGPMSFEVYRQFLQRVFADRQPRSRLVRSKSPQVTRPLFEPVFSMKRTIDNAKTTLNSPKPYVPFSPSDEQRKRRDRIKDEDIERRLLRKLPSHLPEVEDKEVATILRKRGVVAKFAREQVSDADISRLNPGQWLNDEIVNFYGAMILARSEGNKENAQVGGKAGRNSLLDVHYFSSFFWPKLTKEGYEQGRLAKWTKKINIFSKDVILIPVNHSNAHWTAAAINFRKKRIESYDSMGMANQVVFTYLREYLDAEHRDKKKKPFDFSGWGDIAPEDTPQQENGFDCGVFTCHFLEALSRGVEYFAFTQQNMPYLRRRMIWEIGNAQLRNDYK